jgi:hypothetical protein
MSLSSGRPEAFAASRPSKSFATQAERYGDTSTSAEFQAASAARLTAALKVDQNAASKGFLYEEIFNAADEIESLSIGLKEACCRSDEARTHGYFRDIVRCGAELRSADERLAALGKLSVAK